MKAPVGKNLVSMQFEELYARLLGMNSGDGLTIWHCCDKERNEWKACRIVDISSICKKEMSCNDRTWIIGYIGASDSAYAGAFETAMGAGFINVFINDYDVSDDDGIYLVEQ